MPVSRFISAALLLAAIATATLALATLAWAQSPTGPGNIAAPEPVAESVGHGFETIGRALREFAGLPADNVEAGAFRATRHIEEQFPVSNGAVFDLDTQFTHITVTGWSEPVLALDLTVETEAPTTDAARALAELVTLDLTQDGNRIMAHAQFPRESPEGARIALTGVVKAPYAMALDLTNAFGRTTVRDMQGAVTIDHRFGPVDLDAIGGALTLRATSARVTSGRLTGEAALFLADCETTLAPVDGACAIQMAGGALEMATPAPGAQVNLVAQAAKVTLRNFPADGALEAAMLHGEITGAPPAVPVTVGALAQLRNGAGEPTVRLGLAFGTLHFDARPAVLPKNPATANKRPESVETQLYEATDEDTLPLENVARLALVPGPADVRLVGENRKNIRFMRTRRVWGESPAHASTLFDAIGADATHSGDAVTLSHRVGHIGDARYTVTWEVRYPAGMPVRIAEGAGSVSFAGPTGDVDIDHAGGEIRLENAQGTLRILQKAGGVALENCTGAADIEAVGGPVDIRGHKGDIRINTTRGNTSIEDHQGALEVDARDGDVRVLSGPELTGDMDIRCETGHAALLLPPTASANLDIRLEAGQIYSAIPLAGTVEEGRQALHALLGAGEHRIRVECAHGNVRIDQGSAAQ